MRRIFLLLVVFLFKQPFLFSQQPDTITEKEVDRIVRYLAADSLMGRGNGRPELLKAGLFIGDYFRKNNLQPLPGFPGYFIPFRPFGGSKNAVTDQLTWNGKEIPLEQFDYVQSSPGNYKTKTLRDFTVIKWSSSFSEDVLKQLAKDTVPLLVWTNKKQSDGKNFFPEKISMPPGGIKRAVLLVYAESAPESITLAGNAHYYSMMEYNVISVLPGKTKSNEVIVFSAHYDHEGVYPGRRDSILNGANDNASGTTALLLLAHYFSKRNDNERTIMFCAFAGEELGLTGSSDFSRKLNPETLVAGINIEMIGVPQYGKKRVFITGEKYSDLGPFLSKQLRKNNIHVQRDFNEDAQLFLRSDNYPFAAMGVPFHTIMASDDSDACYHQPCDQVNRVDIANMTYIIKAIAASASGLVNGMETPKRIHKESLPKRE